MGKGLILLLVWEGGGHFVSYYIYVDVNMGFVLVKNLGYSFTGHTIAIIGFVFSSFSYFLDIVLKLIISFLVQVANKKSVEGVCSSIARGGS